MDPKRWVWTDEKHLNFLNTMESSFVRTMLHHYAVVSPLRLDRYLPDSSESTLDSKPPPPVRRGRRTKKRSSHLRNSSKEQAASPLENERESAACDDKYPKCNV